MEREGDVLIRKKLIEHFSRDIDSSTHDDISVQTIDYFDPNDQERRFGT